MSLVDCTECNRRISDQAVTCPGCGVPRSPVSPTPSAFRGSPPLAKEGVVPQVEISETIAGSVHRDEICAELTRRIQQFEGRFDASTMAFKKGGSALSIAIKQDRTQWIVTARHNLPSRRGGTGVSTVVVFMLFLFLSIIFSWWMMAVFVAMALYGASMQPNIMGPELASCLSSTREHFATHTSPAVGAGRIPEKT